MCVNSFLSTWTMAFEIFHSLWKQYFDVFLSLLSLSPAQVKASTNTSYICQFHSLTYLSLSLQLQTPSLSKFLQSLMIGIPIWCIGQVSFSLHFETQNWTEGNGGIGQGQIIQSFSARLKQRISTYFVRITVQLTYYFDWFGFSNFITLPSLAVLLVGWIKTSQTGGQLKSDIFLLEVV